MSAPELAASDIASLLDSLLDPDCESAVAFDADGTLWTGDVGETVFDYAIDNDLLRDEALPRLRREARDHGIDQAEDANRIARNLYSLYQAGGYSERRVCEMMVWCYAGMSEEELRALTAEALRATDFEGTLNHYLVPLLEWARERGCRTLVISASPTLVVNEAARMLGFLPEDVRGGRAALETGVIAPLMQEPLPYGPGKVEAGRGAMGTARWLASYGDSAFDLDMMREAQLAVGVRPKPELRMALAKLTRAVVLRATG